MIKYIQTQYRKLENTARKYPATVLISVLIACGLIIISRRLGSVTNPQFWAEDGKYWYADAYNSTSLDVIFKTYGGYFVVIYRLVATFSLLLPFKYAPLFFNIIALCFQLLPVILICSSRFIKIIPSKVLAITICLVYAAIPNSGEVFLNLSNIQWHLGLTSLLVLIAIPGKKIIWNVYDFTVLIATGLAGPFVIILLPFSFTQWYRTKTHILKLRLILLAALSIAQAISILFISHYPRVGGDQKDASLWKFIKMITGQVYTGGILGEKYVDLFYKNHLILILVFLLGTSLIIYTLRYGPYWIKLLIAFASFSVLAMLASLKPTSDFDVWIALTNPGSGQRYWYIPIVIWIAVILWIAFSAKNHLVRGIGISVLSILIFIGIPTGWIMKNYYQDLDFQGYAHSFEEAQSGTQISIPINPAWQMNLTKR